MKIVFVGGPVRGDGSVDDKKKKITVAKEWAERLMAAGVVFYSPHMNLSELRMQVGATADQYAIDFHKEFLMRSDILAVLPGWQESSGTQSEIAWAKEKGLPVVYLEEEGSIEGLIEMVAQ